MHDAAKSAAAVSPPVFLTGLHYVGLHLPDILSILTIIYTAAQIGILCWKGAKALGASRAVAP